MILAEAGFATIGAAPAIRTTTGRGALDSKCCRLFGIMREIMEIRTSFDPARDDGALEG
jgi:hypothetical protein